MVASYYIKYRYVYFPGVKTTYLDNRILDTTLESEVIMNNTQVCEAFSNGETEGRGSNLFIDGDTIYSYGHHFPIAKHTDKFVDGKEIILFTTKSYSVTTAKHKNYVFHALIRPLVNKFFIIETDNIDADPIRIGFDLNNQLVKIMCKRDSARSSKMREFWRNEETSKREQVNVTRAMF